MAGTVLSPEARSPEELRLLVRAGASVTQARPKDGVSAVWLAAQVSWPLSTFQRLSPAACRDSHCITAKFLYRFFPRGALYLPYYGLPYLCG